MPSILITGANRGIITVALHPGRVRTCMGGNKAPLRPADSAQDLKKVLL